MPPSSKRERASRRKSLTFNPSVPARLRGARRRIAREARREPGVFDRGSGQAHGLRGVRGKNLERETGFEPATSTLARSHSTTELFPLDRLKYHTAGLAFNSGGPHSVASGAAPARLYYTRTARSTRVASSGDVGLM